MSKKDGGPAFPCIEATCTGIDSDGFERWEARATGGMSLRDYFAAKASDEDIREIMERYPRSLHCKETITRQQARYIHADAMLAEREK